MSKHLYPYLLPYYLSTIVPKSTIVYLSLPKSYPGLWETKVLRYYRGFSE